MTPRTEAQYIQVKRFAQFARRAKLMEQSGKLVPAQEQEERAFRRIDVNLAVNDLIRASSEILALGTSQLGDAKLAADVRVSFEGISSRLEKYVAHGPSMNWDKSANLARRCQQH